MTLWRLTLLLTAFLLTLAACRTGSNIGEIYFETGSAQIQDVSKTRLNEVADFLKKNPHIVKVQIAAHADSRGSDSDNLELTQKRARAVVSYLESRGIKSERLYDVGYGEACPLNTSNTEADENRRVDFNIMETVTGCTTSPVGCSRAKDEGLLSKYDKRYLPGSDHCADRPRESAYIILP